MSIYTIIGIVAVLTFVAWLFFSNSKKPKRPNFTEGKSKYPLYDINSMLSNITEKQKPDNVPETVDQQVADEKTISDEIIDEKKSLKNDKNKKNNNQNNKFDLKSAVIGANIIERKKT